MAGKINLLGQHTTESSVLPSLSCFALKLVKLGVLRFYKLGALD